MTVHIHSHHLGCASARATSAMFMDARFYEILGTLTPGAEQVDLSIDLDAGTVRWTQRIQVPESVPASLRSMIGSTLTLVEEQRWRHDQGRAHIASVDVRPAGLPAQLVGTFTIHEPPAPLPADGGADSPAEVERCTVAVEGHVQVAIPFFAGKVESVIAENFTSALSLRSQAALLWQE